MFIELKKAIITEIGLQDLQALTEANTNRIQWQKTEDAIKKGFIQTHLTRIDGLLDALVNDKDQEVITYKETTTLDEERLKAEHPVAFTTCSELKLNVTALKLFHPELEKQYRKPAARRLLIA
jgi:hypothetical protein